MTLKERLFQHCTDLLRLKIQREQAQLNELKEITANETKSSAGDKYETARAMLQIEQDNTRCRLTELLIQQSLLQQINIKVQTPQISAGNLIKTSRGYFFLSVALGKIVLDEITVIAVSPKSPLGQKLTGLKCNDSITVNGACYIIEHFE